MVQCGSVACAAGALIGARWRNCSLVAISQAFTKSQTPSFARQHWGKSPRERDRQTDANGAAHGRVPCCFTYKWPYSFPSVLGGYACKENR
ncbi:hypothetical protein LX32DRAFT_27114 [Colletotrichum zoysiae]|uniref:Uncharacterized protein n=1 Tax=Colletotrichum zoysiae TaxID=1216348 RepID=A0AAD9HRN3_9PEZI|nr:hypothetical protein LX32DRAFT_27114 [Colletotrichum zoysiae]